MDLEGGAQTGADIVISACERPFYKILENAGYSQEAIGDIELDIKEQGYGHKWHGYNPRTEEHVDMFDAGIIDPTKVTRLALENAASVAGTLLITEAVVSTKKDKSAEQPGMDPSMMMG
jgi:chaperonin GroEL